MVITKKYIKHLDDKWCKLTTAVAKKMKQEFYLPWHFETEHVTDLICRLYEDQVRLAENGIAISDEDKTQHFVEQMYASRMFDMRM